MKTDRHSPPLRSERVKLGSLVSALLKRSLSFTLLLALLATSANANEPSAAVTTPDSVSRQTASATEPAAEQQSQPQAIGLLRRVLELIVHGGAFDAKVRETVWTTGREVVGVGTYEQAGAGSGRFNLQITMHDGDGKHRLQQISDGRLAWTRTEISGNVSLRRVDVSRLDQWVGDVAKNMRVSPGLRVGGWAEILCTIERDYVLRVDGAHLKDEPVWVISGVLRKDRRQQILAKSGREQWPNLYPTRVRVALKSKPDAKTGFGQLLPIRMEYWSDPVAGGNSAVAAENLQGRLITLIELYSIRPIAPPSPQRFRFENQDAEVNFINETDQYIEMYGVQLTQRERRQLRR